MCSQGGGKSTPINGVMHACYLCDHAKALEKIRELNELLKQSLSFLEDTQDEGPYGQGWKSQKLENLICKIEEEVTDHQDNLQKIDPDKDDEAQQAMEKAGLISHENFLEYRINKILPSSEKCANPKCDKPPYFHDAYCSEECTEEDLSQRRRATEGEG